MLFFVIACNDVGGGIGLTLLETSRSWWLSTESEMHDAFTVDSADAADMADIEAPAVTFTVGD
jgi:hypothetical protein